MMHLSPAKVLLTIFLSFGGLSLSQASGNMELKTLEQKSNHEAVDKNLRAPLNEVVEPIRSSSIMKKAHFESRKLLSWANVVKFILHPPHPPHPHHNSGGSSSGGSSSGGSSSGGSSSASAATSSSSGGSSSSAYWSGSDSSSGTSSATTGTSDEMGNGGSKISQYMTPAATVTMFAVAAAAAVAAMGAVVMGRRQQTVQASHPLRGGLNKRIALFSNFANKQTVDRPDLFVEMTPTGNEADYVRA